MRCLKEQAIPLAKKIENHDWLSTLYDSYAELFNILKKNDSAYLYQKRSSEEREIADFKMSSSQVRLLAAELDSKSQKLNNFKDRLELQKKQNKINRMTLLLILGLLLILLVFTISYIRVQKSKLKLHNQQVKSARKIIALQENLNERHAMELHDLVGPMSTSLNRQIESLEIQDPELKNEIKQKLTSVTESIHEISRRMRRVSTDQLTFNELIHGICKDMQQLTAVPINLEMNNDKFVLNQETETHIYRIIQELLTNAVKYVKTGSINISLDNKFERLYILYQDSGPGFDLQNPVQNGMGITNIRERAFLVGGTAELTTASGKGTTWNISIPLNKN